MAGKRRESNRESSWLVRRTLASLLATPHDAKPQHRDAGVQIEAMAAFIRYSGRQVAMPVLRQTAGRETLVDGQRVIAALQGAGWSDAVTTLLLARESPYDESARPFSKAEAEATGTDAALLSLSVPPSEEVLCWLNRSGLAHPDRVDELHLGWKTTATELGWLPFVRKIEDFDSRFGIVTALNGRRPAWLASYRLPEPR